MGKATRPLSGAGQKKYFRDLIQSTEGVSPNAANSLISICEREIAQIRVRLPIPDRGPKGTAFKKQDSAKAPVPVATNPIVDDAAFDPFAFSVVVVVTREGREGLARKLQALTSAIDLHALARAQHLALPDGNLTVDELRTAIVEGALQRVANRKAAAS